MVVDVRGTTFHMDKTLIEKWTSLKGGELAKYDEDRVYIVDGEEGSGKSLFTIQQASFIDPSVLDEEDGLPMPRICFSVNTFLKAIKKTRSTKEHTKVVIFDEAFRGLSSKSALSKNNKMLVEALMEARQNNLVVFIVSPSFYLIEFYAAVLRSKALFHVVKEKNSRRRYVRVFGKKNKATLYQIGVRKGWGYPIVTKHRVRFFNIYPGGDEFEAKYRKKKRDSLNSGEEDEKEDHKWQIQRDAAIKMLYEDIKSHRKLEKMFAERDIIISDTQIGAICRNEHGNKIEVENDPGIEVEITPFSP